MPDCSFGTIPFRVESGVVKFLIVWQSWGDGHWCFPKGHPEDGEAPIETALRELKEETGFVPEEILSTTPLIQEYSFKYEGRTVHRRLEYFVVRLGGGEVSIQSAELGGSKWVTLEELLELTPFPEIHNNARQAHDLVTKGNA